MSANPARGEADLKIGSVELTIAVTFAGLSRLSKMMGAQSMDEVYQRVLGFEPWAASCALRALAVHEDEAEAKRLALKAIEELSTADETAFRQAVERAFLGHLEQGKITRGEKPLSEEIEGAAADADEGEPASPA